MKFIIYKMYKEEFIVMKIYKKEKKSYEEE